MSKEAKEKKARPVAKKKLQSRQTTAEQANVDIRTIDRMIKAGKIEALKIGRRVMVRIADANRLFGD
jgi:excisionase family DNA binding protein